MRERVFVVVGTFDRFLCLTGCLCGSEAGEGVPLRVACVVRVSPLGIREVSPLGIHEVSWVFVSCPLRVCVRGMPSRYLRVVCPRIWGGRPGVGKTDHGGGCGSTPPLYDPSSSELLLGCESRTRAGERYTNLYHVPIA